MKNSAVTTFPVSSFPPLTAEMKMLIRSLSVACWLPTAPEGRLNVEVRFHFTTVQDMSLITYLTLLWTLLSQMSTDNIFSIITLHYKVFNTCGEMPIKWQWFTFNDIRFQLHVKVMLPLQKQEQPQRHPVEHVDKNTFTFSFTCHCPCGCWIYSYKSSTYVYSWLWSLF